MRPKDALCLAPTSLHASMTQRCTLGFSSSGFASDAEEADPEKSRLGLLSECMH